MQKINYFPLIINYTDLSLNALVESIDDIQLDLSFTVIKTDASESDLDLLPQSHAKCKCGSTNLTTISAKHDDRFSLDSQSLHLGSIANYAPKIGILGGDQTTLTLCLDCGQTQNWKPISQLDLIRAIFGDE